jgi:phosphatidylglycerol:prolipoprotein diacylglycerol transferase
MNINPVAFTIGTLEVYWYGILIAAAFLLGSLLALKEAEFLGWDQDQFLNVLLVCIPGSILGARLYYVIFNWEHYSRFPGQILATWQGGLAIHGGIMGGVLAGYFMVRKYGLNFGQGLDIIAPSLILGQAIGRWGNFFNQEAYGYEVDPERLPWAMYIDGAYRHPTFLYESLWNLAVFFFLLWFRRRRGLLKGDVFLVYAILYSVGRFFIEGLRTDSLMLTPFLRAAQVLSAAIIIGGGALLYWRYRN